MKKGFTLVELLAVIVILAIILAIAVPTISSLIENSKKSMFQNSAKMILKSMKNDYDGKIATTGAFTDTFILYEDGVRTVYPSSNNLDFTISATDGGIVRHSDGTVTFALHDGTNCAIKNRKSTDVTVSTIDKAQCISNIIYKQVNAPFNTMLTNGDFSNGTTGWSLSGISDVRVSNGVLEYTGTPNNNYPLLTNNLNTANRYYAAIMAKSLSSIYLRLAYSAISFYHSPNYQFEFLSGVSTVTTSLGNISYRTTASYSGETVYIDYFLLIDLTSTYGAGNEPTKEQMDNNVNKVWIDIANANTPKKFGGGGWVNF